MAEERSDRINRLQMEMIALYRGDTKRIQHFCKVYQYARLIGQEEKLHPDMQLILEAAALTHDIGIHHCEEMYGESGGKLQEQEGPAIARKLLYRLSFPPYAVERVSYLIAHHHTYQNIQGNDYRILVEADFLVNLFEDGISKEGIYAAYNNIFRTETGRKLCREMYDITE